MKTSELTGALLDYWVARASPQCADLTFERRGDHIVGHAEIDGEKVVCIFLHDGNVLATMRLRRKYQSEPIYYSPSRDWAQGGPIIAQSSICINEIGPTGAAEWCASVNGGMHWNAKQNFYSADVPLVAAMRAYVASVFGDEVPDELSESSPVGADKE